MLTTVTPAAQEFSIPSSAASPPNDAPYPTLVGTAITGTLTMPPTTLGSAPSMPATTITTRARCDLLAGRQQSMQPGHPHVHQPLHRMAEGLGHHRRLFGYRKIAGAGGDDEDGAGARCARLLGAGR